MAVSDVTALVGHEAILADDDAKLRALGYTPVLWRAWGAFTAITLTISAMSVLTSITASFGTGLTYGGPVVCVWGWIGASFCMLCVALGMAELSSAYPTSGGMYYWQFRLAGPKVGPFACWITGWLNLLGQIASVSAVAFLCSGLIHTMASMAATVNGGTPYALTPAQDLGVYGGCIFLVALLNSCGLTVLTLVTQLGGMFHLVGVTLLILIVPLMATSHQSAGFVFTKFETQLAIDSGITNYFNIAILGLLLPAYSYTGMDGCAAPAAAPRGSAAPARARRGACRRPSRHTHTRTRAAQAGAHERGGGGREPRAAKAILVGWGVMFVGGLGMIISLLFSMTGIEAVLDETNPAAGNAVGQIMYDASMQRFGSPRVGIGLMSIIILGVFTCNVATLTYVSRILFCYSRDRAVPLSGLWQKVDKRTKSPLAAIWGVALGAFLLGLPMLGSSTAFNAILSLSTISLIIAYVSPITARISWGRRYFEPGPFNLGVWAYPVGVVATLWAIFAAVVFCLPIEMPVDADNLNYAAVAFVGTCTLSTLFFYCPVIGAYKWFKGPRHTVDDDSAHVREGPGEFGKGTDAA
ncbi:BAT1 [Scenedesmus sp. PABB004]|nr:BAT1 [Scenedesmus sp. PABB004]